MLPSVSQCRGKSRSVTERCGMIFSISLFFLVFLSGVLRCVSECFGVFPIVSEYFVLFQSVFECFLVFRSVY